MTPALTAYLPFFAAFWFFLAAGYLLYKLQQLPGNAQRMYPVAAYLFGIGLFFVFSGWSTFAVTSCPAIDCTDTAGGLAVMLAASFIAHFPLQDLTPTYNRLVLGAMVVFSVVATAVTAVTVPALQVPLAHVYAFVVAGLFTVGYMFYAAYLDDSPGGMGISLSMSSCCVVAHGLAAVPLVVAVSMPLVGVSTGLPVVFAILSPISLIAVVAFFGRVESKMEREAPVGTDASP